MNKINHCVGLGLLSFLLSGCGIGGWWMNGNPFLEAPQPTLQQWEKLGINPERRREDAVKCGADPYSASTDWAPGTSRNQIVAAQRNDETERQTSLRLYHAWERCMLKTGYQFTGPCIKDSKFSSARPACGAP